MSHLYISNKWGSIVQCYGLTKDPSNGQFIIVMSCMDIDLRTYILQNRNKIKWKTKIQIIFEIIKAVCRIHEEKSIHRDLHSGNVLYSRDKDDWYISDLGFCGPADKSLKSVYGNLPYISPEVIAGKGYTFKSDIYAIGMLMWEISAEQPPYINVEHNYDLVMSIINGMRPPTIPGTPSEYKELLYQCWNADPNARPDIKTLWNRIETINKSHQEDEEYWDSLNSPLNPNFDINSTVMSFLISKSNSKIHNFDNIPKPRNATEGKDTVF